jgi:hypothetical protein
MFEETGAVRQSVSSKGQDLLDLLRGGAREEAIQKLLEDRDWATADFNKKIAVIEEDLKILGHETKPVSAPAAAGKKRGRPPGSANKNKGADKKA